MSQKTELSELEHKVFVRCIEEGECWLWQGAISGGERGAPCVNWGGKTQLVRKMLWEARNGPVKTGCVVSATCGNRMCVSPHCAVHVTNKTSKRMAAARGAYSGADRIRKALSTIRARSWITPDVVDAVKAARTAKEAHEQTGVSLSWAKAIRRGDARTEFSNPFAGLFAANDSKRRAA